MLPYNEKLRDRSRQLRKEATQQERHLWFDFLKTSPIQFNRQKIIGNFIVDFYCDKAKLAIELDGTQHNEEDAKLYDEERTAYLSGLGITVLRFTNADIDNRFVSVCSIIDEKVKAHINPRT